MVAVSNLRNKSEVMRRILCGRPVAYATITTVFAALFFLHWGIWGNLIADTFRDQWVFHALNNGRVLYRDVTYLYGPLPPYLMAFLQRIFGEHLAVSIAIGTALCGITTLCIYRCARLSLPRFFAAVPAVVFLAVFGIPS